MKLIENISRLWHAKKAYSQTDYIEIDRTPTAEEEEAGFANPSKMLARAHHTNFLQDIKLRRKFAIFSMRSAPVWIWFLIITTAFEGTGGGFNIKLDGINIQIPKFHLEQWAFVAICGSTTVSIVGLANIVARYLFG